jgi:hypothetical protein
LLCCNEWNSWASLWEKFALRVVKPLSQATPLCQASQRAELASETFPWCSDEI